MAEFDAKKIRKALEGALKYKKKYEELLGGKAVSEQLLESVTENLGEVLKPVLQEMVENAEIANQSLVKGINEALRGHKTEDSSRVVAALQAGFRGLRLPTPRVDMKAPIVNVPPVKVVNPDLIKAVLNYDYKNPLPVIMMGLDGKPFQFSSTSGGGASGRGDFFTISNVTGSTASLIDQIEGGLKVVVLNPSSVSGGGATTVSLVNVDGDYYNSDNPFPVTVSNIFGSTAANVVNPDGRLKVELPTGSSGLTDAELRAAHLDVQQVSGAIDSVYVTGAAASTYAEIMSPDGRVKIEGPVSVSGSINSSVVVGDTVADEADSGSAPVKVGGIARTANPSAAANGDRVSTTHDDTGRPVFRQHQLRDLIATAYVSLSNGTETTLLAAAGAGVFHDLIYIMGANQSSAAVQVDIRAVSGGNIVMTLYIPANSTAGVSLPVPFPQDATNNAWTADLPDITGTVVNLSALFSKEV